MTEHVCEWVLRDNHAVCLARNEKGNRCYAVLLGPEIISRLNATERLSAKDARFYGELSGITLIRDAMQAYANILEGKDE